MNDTIVVSYDTKPTDTLTFSFTDEREKKKAEGENDLKAMRSQENVVVLVPHTENDIKKKIEEGFGKET